jgi:hypothetical protein
MLDWSVVAQLGAISMAAAALGISRAHGCASAALQQWGEGWDGCRAAWPADLAGLGHDMMTQAVVCLA